MVKRAPAKRRPRKAKPGTKGLAPSESILEKLDGPAADAAAVVEKVGGHLVASYKERFNLRPTTSLLCVLQNAAKSSASMISLCSFPVWTMRHFNQPSDVHR